MLHCAAEASRRAVSRTLAPVREAISLCYTTATRRLNNQMREDIQGARRAAMTAEPIVRSMIVAHQAARVDADRLKQCGLVYHIRQRDHFAWVGPPEHHTDGQALVKVLPLLHAQPRPNLEIRAHGETYLVPHDFRGGWFDVVSPAGRRLIE